MACYCFGVLLILIHGERFAFVGFLHKPVVLASFATAMKSYGIAEMDLFEFFEADAFGELALGAVQEVEEKPATKLHGEFVTTGFVYSLKLGAHFSSAKNRHGMKSRLFAFNVNTGNPVYWHLSLQQADSALFARSMNPAHERNPERRDTPLF
jgi:hypothetical protein